MTDEISLDAVHAQRAGSRLAAAADQILRLGDTSGGRIEQAGLARPWGTDKLGQSFEKMSEDGATRYLDVAEAILSLWRSASQRAVRMGDDIVRSARESVITDQRAAGRIDAIRGPGQ